MPGTPVYPKPIVPTCASETVPLKKEKDKEPRKKKNIVICCDGTGNNFTSPNAMLKTGSKTKYVDGLGQNSNVIKLYTALTIDNDQVGYYHPGVGTMGSPSANHWFTKWWTKVEGLAFGAGFRDNVLDAYRFLMESYEENNGNPDDVYIFGFSRGAYTARALAGLLCGFGLLCKGNEGHLPYAWRSYVDQHDDRTKTTVHPEETFKATFSHPNFRIHFLGVWDTVSSVGWISSPVTLFNVATNDIIDHGRHAISIDEHRCFFQDNLWGSARLNQDLQQVWFAGVHSDVGGSYPQPESGLSDLSLCWMLKEAEKVGIQLDAERRQQIFGIQPPKPVHKNLLYDKPADARLHKSLTGLGWWIAEFIPRIYYDIDGAKEKRRVPFGRRYRQIPSGSLIHASVATRLDDPTANYHPKQIRRNELVEPPVNPNAPQFPSVTPVPHLEAQPAAIKAAPVPVSQDDTRYFRYSPIGRDKNKALEYLDRFVVVPVFTVVELWLVYCVLSWLVSGLIYTVRHLPHAIALANSYLSQHLWAHSHKLWYLLFWPR